jgi:hypothetical protein
MLPSLLLPSFCSSSTSHSLYGEARYSHVTAKPLPRKEVKYFPHNRWKKKKKAQVLSKVLNWVTQAFLSLARWAGCADWSWPQDQITFWHLEWCGLGGDSSSRVLVIKLKAQSSNPSMAKRMASMLGKPYTICQGVFSEQIWGSNLSKEIRWGTIWRKPHMNSSITDLRNGWLIS